MFCVGLIDKLSCPNWKSLFLYSTVFFLLKASVDKSGVVTNQKNSQEPQKLSSLKSFKIQTLPSGIFTTVTIRNGFLIKFEMAKLKQRKNRSTDNGNMAETAKRYVVCELVREWVSLWGKSYLKEAELQVMYFFWWSLWS